MLKTIIGYTEQIAKQFEQTYQILLKKYCQWSNT